VTTSRDLPGAVALSGERGNDDRPAAVGRGCLAPFVGLDRGERRARLGGEWGGGRDDEHDHDRRNPSWKTGHARSFPTRGVILERTLGRACYE